MTSKDLLTLLSIRHDRDIFVTEIGTPCKHRMDAYAVRRSWTRANTFGYEIKVRRQDFLRDDKWQVYLKYCNEFYFVVPWGICEPQEMPEDAGLIVASKTGNRLFTKRRASKRVRNLRLDEMFRAILINRFQVSQHENNLDYWRRWLMEKDERQRIGWKCSARIRQLYEQNVTSVVRENTTLKNRILRLERIEKVANELGIDMSSWHPEKQFANMVGGIPKDEALKSVDQVITTLQRLKEKFEGERP